MNNKRGISAVIATVLIILITVAAVTIVWAVVIPMVRNSLSEGTVCFDATAAVSIGDVHCIDEVAAVCTKTAPVSTDPAVTADCVADTAAAGFTVVSAASATIRLQASRGATSVDLKDLQVLVYESGNTEASFKLQDAGRTEDSVILGINEEKTYVLLEDGDDDFSTATHIAIASVVTIGNTDKECEAGEKVVLTTC